MKPIIKKMLMISGTMIAVGILLMAIAFAAGKAQGFYISPSHGLVMDSERKDFKSGEIALDDIKEIDAQLDDGDIELQISDHYYIEYNYQNTMEEPEYEVKDGILSFSDKGSSGFHIMNFGFGGMETGKVTIGLPKEAYLDNITIENDDGDTTLKQISAKELDISSSYGELIGDALNIDNANIRVDDGKIKLENSKIKVMEGKTDYTDIVLDQVSFASFVMKISDGDLKSRYIDFNKADIISDYCNMDLSLAQEEARYTYDLKVDYGDITINGDEKDDEEYSTGVGEKVLKVDASDGDITIQDKR